MQARDEPFVFRNRKSRDGQHVEQHVEQHVDDGRPKSHGCHDENCHKCYWDLLFGTRNCKKRVPTHPESPTYVGKEEDKNDCLIDFEATSPSLDATSDESSLAESWDDCLAFPFLQLPKEIRLLVYEFSFPSSSSPVVVEFDRDMSPQQGYFPPPKKQREPKLRYDRFPNTQINGGLVVTCKSIYEEALPLLYKNVIFHPKDNEGLLPVFLQRQQHFASRSIQCIRLNMGLSEPKPQARFHWAVTCAQISRLSSTLGRVEVQLRNKEELPSHVVIKNMLRTLVKPLCKIACQKSLIFPDEMSSENCLTLSEGFHQAIKEGEKALAERRISEADTKSWKAQDTEQGRVENPKQDENQNHGQNEPLFEDWETLSGTTLDSDWEDLEGEYDEFKETDRLESDQD